MTNLAKDIHSEDLAVPDGAGVFERHPTPSLLFTREGRITHVNEAARESLHAHAVDLAGSPVQDLIPAVASPYPARPQEHARTIVRRTDGSSFNARVRIVPAGEGPGALMLASVEDLSDLDREIDAANREFESLTSAAGHDLRGPLRILKGFTEALEDECAETLSEDGRNFLGEILRASDRMEGLLDGLLAFSRAGRGDLSRENLDLTTLIELVFYELRHGQGERVVECQVEPGLNAFGDVRLMMTVLRNLIGNAWKFSSRNASARIICNSAQHEGRTWICVTDDGAGFDTSQSARLFKPFTRLHRQDEFPGHGMGLATAQRIIRRHGGGIAAESVPGETTTVRFWLPGPSEM